MLTIFNPWVILAWVGSLIAAAIFGYANNNEADEVTASYEHANKVAVEARAKRIAQARDQERQLQAFSDEDRRRRRAEEERNTATLLATIGELRNRPDRPAPSGPGGANVHPGATGTGPAPRGCTGADLYRDDAELLARYAAAAVRFKSAAESCHVKYGEAQKKLRAQGLPRDSP